MSKHVKLISQSKNGRKCMVVITNTEDKTQSETLHLADSGKHKDLFTSKDGRVFNKLSLLENGELTTD